MEKNIFIAIQKNARKIAEEDYSRRQSMQNKLVESLNDLKSSVNEIIGEKMILNRSHIVDATYSAIDVEGSQKALCDLVGISQTALSLFLSGDRNPPYALLAYLGYGQKTVYYKLKED